jgi:hypothetical protein
VGACDPIGDSDFDRYERARQQWQRAHVMTYEMTLVVSCFCGLQGPMIVSVRDGLVTEAHRVSDGQSLDTRWVPTVDTIFTRIDAAFRQRHGTIDLEFDAALGFPRHANLDPIRDAVDDEVSYQVSNLSAPLESR